MKNKLSSDREKLKQNVKARASRIVVTCCLLTAVGLFDIRSVAAAASAPAWMRAQVNTPMPDHDEKADAALLYAETTLTVAPNGTIKKLGRLVFKILRPDGEKYGTVGIPFDAQSKITSLHAWSIPAAGKDYEVKEKEAVESAVVGVENSVLVSDVRTKLMRIPAATPGSIVGYEYEQEQRPYMMIDEWDFQSTVPVREAHFALRLPRGWNYNATWINHAEVSPTASEGAKDGSKLFQWTMNDVNPVRHEDLMPPWQGIAARMVIALQPPNGQDSGMQSWRDIGVWYASLTRGRRDASPEIKKQVADLTATAISPLQKMQALAKFVQNDVRYVAIELGIGGFQPHPAVDVFKNRFGDCKDKATLLSTMLKEVGIESYYVVINTERGSMDAMTPPNLGFNHVILAIALPSNIEDATLLARATQPQLANILFFDPTDEFTPFGRLRGELQANFGLLVTADGGELVKIPRLPTSANAIERSAQMTMDEKGTLHGDIVEVWLGDRAGMQRALLRNTTQETNRIKPVERLVASSMASFEIQKAAVANLREADKPFEWHYSLEAPNYAKVAGNLLLVRPRLLGSKASGFLETKEPREHAIEFEQLLRDKDVFEIALPNGYEVDELPPALNLDEGFASYQSKTEVVGRKLRYTRTFEIKDLTVPANKAEKLKRFYRIIGDEERRLAVLKRTTQ